MKLNQRFEIKFNLSTLQEVQFELWMLRAGAKKKFSDRIVNSVYFDTPYCIPHAKIYLVIQNAKRGELGGIILWEK